VMFSVNTEASVSVVIYTLSGRVLKSLEKDKPITGGNVETDWDGKDEAGNTVSNGIYLCKVVAVKGTVKKEAIGRIVKMK